MSTTVSAYGVTFMINKLNYFINFWSAQTKLTPNGTHVLHIEELIGALMTLQAQLSMAFNLHYCIYFIIKGEAFR